LDVDGPNAGSAVFKQVGDLGDTSGFGLGGFRTYQTINDDSTAPGIRRTVADATRHGQASGRLNEAAAERELRLVYRDRIFAVEIAGAVVEE
jgi:hypothetical protein